MRIAGIIFISILGLIGAQAQEPPAAFSESVQYVPRVFLDKKGQKKAGDISKVTRGVPANSSQPRSVALPVSVFDQQGMVVAGLGKENFSLVVGGDPVAIESVDQPDGPIDLVLLFDMSPSTDSLIAAMKSMAVRIVEKLQPNDRVMVAAFAQNLAIKTDFTSDRAAIAKAVKRLEMSSGTSLYTSLAELVSTRINRPAENVAIVIFTDGVDTVSKKFSYETSLAAVERSGIAIFPVYFDTFLDASRRTNFSFPIPIQTQGPTKEEYERGRFYLTDLAHLSGGHAVVGARLLRGTTVSFDSIPEQIRSRTVLRFPLPTAAATSGRTNLRVRVNRPNLFIQARSTLFH